MSSTPVPSRTFTETARRVQLIDAAIVAVNEVGYHGASLSVIASRAGVAKSAIVYYFSSKESLLLSVVDEVFTQLEAAVAPAARAETEPAAQLRAYAQAYLAHIDTHRARITAGIEIVVSHRTGDGTPLYLTGTEADSPSLRDILVNGMAAGAFRQMPLHLAVTLVASVLDVWTTELQRDPGIDIGTLGEDTIDFLVKGLAPTPPTG